MNHTPLALTALALSALALAGCSAPAGSAPTSEVAAATDLASCSAEDTTLKVTFGQQATEAMQIAVAALEKKHPGLKVDAQPQATSSYDDLTKTIVADIAVGKRPDLIMSGLGQLRFWVDEYDPAPIDPAALSDTYQAQFLDAGTVDGTPYLAPAQISAPVLLVNQDLLDEAGAGDATDIETYDDWIAAAKKVTTKTGAPSVTIATTGLADWYSQAFVQGAGGTFIADDGTAAFGDDTGTAALGIWSELKERGLEMGIVNDQDSFAQFAGGKAAFMVYTTSVIASAQSTIGEAFDWAPIDLPTENGERGALPAGGNGWIVLSDDGCRAAFANALVGELLSTDAVLGASGTSYSYIPVDTAAAEELLASDAATPQLTYAWSYDAPLSAWGGFAGEVTAQVNDAFRTMTQQLQAGAPTAQTVDTAISSIDALVEQAR
ncbi:extracellular solute-binding protein [Microbacterium oxydans]|uniref:extracellular solute-binding protein n=1 Tax=Microbacterium oxydans TaxID=82380 RepID=UPI00226B118E|nr:extracellular solute-binding protein [Microbacterium oxydans]WAA67521.1 extracellular solute-binding protein [Microbacterium oxydans]